MSRAERVRAELDVLGLDVSSHVMDAYAPFLDELGTTRAHDLLGCRSRQQVLVAGVKVATQTPPIRSGRRVIFVTLDDATGPLDATFFEDAQVGYATTVFHSWLLVVQGLVRRTGPRGVSMQAVGCWELPSLHAAWLEGGLDAVWALMATPALVTEAAVQGAAASRSSRPVMTSPPLVGGGAGHSGRRGSGARLRHRLPRLALRRHQARRRRRRHLRRPSDPVGTAQALARQPGQRRPMTGEHSRPRAPVRQIYPSTSTHQSLWSRLRNDLAAVICHLPLWPMVRSAFCGAARPRARHEATDPSCKGPPACPRAPPQHLTGSHPVPGTRPRGPRRRRAPSCPHCSPRCLLRRPRWCSPCPRRPRRRPSSAARRSRRSRRTRARPLCDPVARPGAVAFRQLVLVGLPGDRRRGHRAAVQRRWRQRAQGGTCLGLARLRCEPGPRRRGSPT